MNEPAVIPDELLARLRAASGGRLKDAEIRRLLAGVAGAPQPLDRDRWFQLVADKPDRALLDALQNLVSPASTPAVRPNAAARLAALRSELKRLELAGFLVPHADEQQNEYIPPRAERLGWLTGFTGSAGFAVVLPDRAALFVDGRYTLQARAQADAAFYEFQHLVEQPPSDWLAEHAPEGGRIGYDPWLHTPAQLETLKAAVEKRGGMLVPTERNPVDAIWTDQPAPPIAPVEPHPVEWSGRDAADKRHDIAASLEKAGIDAAIVSDPASIAWLLNIRGGDVAHTPLPLSFAVLRNDGTVELFIEPLKLTAEAKRHLGNGVGLAEPAALGAALDRLGSEGRKVLCDAASASSWIVQRLQKAGAQPLLRRDPCALPRAIKNETELAGMRSAHVRDGAAVVRFLAWLAANVPGPGLDEIAVAEKLFEFRRQDPLFRDLSFDTISGAGPNGAIVHYRSTPATSRLLAKDELYLVDSGAQYADGTTDITRTIAIGTPSAEMRERFTRVLKGHIAIATARFPKGTAGSQLDTLARLPLWQVGLDYDHGTGHGVGSYLGVHDGPQRISKVPNPVALQPGMVLSNEPGYYKTGAYGIRIENLVEVVDSPAARDAAEEQPMLALATLTLAPIDRNLVDLALLSVSELAWLDAYHARVRATLTPLLDKDTATWLETATAPIAR